MMYSVYSLLIYVILGRTFSYEYKDLDRSYVRCSGKEYGEVVKFFLSRLTEMNHNL